MKTLVYLLIMLLSAAISESPEDEKNTKGKDSCTIRVNACTSDAITAHSFPCNTAHPVCVAAEEIS